VQDVKVISLSLGEPHLGLDGRTPFSLELVKNDRRYGRYNLDGYTGEPVEYTSMRTVCVVLVCLLMLMFFPSHQVSLPPLCCLWKG